jgi:hypothetical protein
MPSVRAFGDWTRLGGILAKGAMASQWQGASDKAVLREALRLSRIMKQAFNKGGPDGAPWPPPSELTLAIRAATGFAGKKSMMVTGDLRNSITVKQEDEGVFVGFHNEVTYKDKGSTAALMAIHEFGTVIGVRITDEMRAWWRAMAAKSQGRVKNLSRDKSIMLIKIPPRPLIGPIMESEAGNSAKNIIKGTLQGIGWGEFAALIG